MHDARAWTVRELNVNVAPCEPVENCDCLTQLVPRADGMDGGDGAEIFADAGDELFGSDQSGSYRSCCE